jgi:hypothetical protein
MGINYVHHDVGKWNTKDSKKQKTSSPVAYLQWKQRYLAEVTTYVIDMFTVSKPSQCADL